MRTQEASGSECLSVIMHAFHPVGHRHGPQPDESHIGRLYNVMHACPASDSARPKRLDGQAGKA